MTEEEKTVEEEKYVIPDYAKELLGKIKDPQRKLKYKITIARKLFLNQHTKKSGSNKFQNFDYFELKDIVPDAVEICCLLGLEYDFVLGKRWGTLTVSDVETDATIKYPKERPQIKEGGNINQQLQGIGKTSTYLKRYCMMDFLEVVEADKVDATDNSKKVVTKQTPKKTRPKSSNKQMVLDEVKVYISENLEDQNDMETAQKLLDDLKMKNRINQAVYNKMSSLLKGGSK